MDMNQLGTNSQYIQRQFSVSYVFDHQHGMGGGKQESTRNFGKLGESVQKAATSKLMEMAKTKPSKRTEKDAERMSRLNTLTWYQPKAETHERTKRFRDYESDKTRHKGWESVVFDPNSPYSIDKAPEDVKALFRKAKEYQNHWFNKSGGKKYEKEGLRAYRRWRNKVPKYGDPWETDAKRESQPTPPPYTGPTPPPYNPEPIPTPPPWKPYSGPGGVKLKVKATKA